MERWVIEAVEISPGKDRRMQEEFENIKVVVRIRKSMKNRQHDGQQKKKKGTNNDLHRTAQKTKEPH